MTTWKRKPKPRSRTNGKSTTAAAAAWDPRQLVARLTPNRGTIATGCQWTSDLGLAAIIFVAPLVLAGRHDLGRLVYMALVLIMAAGWLGQRLAKQNYAWRKCPAEWLIIAGALIVACQLVHLPAEILAYLTPFQSQLLPDFAPDLMARLQLRDWDQVSFTPASTWRGLGVFVAHATLFIVLTQKLNGVDDVKRLLKWIAFAAVGMAVFALAQFVSGTPKFAGVFINPSRPANLVVTGPFTNCNHLAHFLALGIGPLIWWLQGMQRTNVTVGPTGNKFHKRSDRGIAGWATLCLTLSIAAVTIAGLLARSRGGALAMAIAACISVGLLYRYQLIGNRSLYGLASIGVLVLIALTFYGYDDVTQELRSLTSGSLEQIDDSGGRRKIWAANLQVAQKFPVLGTGVGSHREVYHRFFPSPSMVEYSHAESGYLQILTETGIAGLALMLIGIGYCLNWTWKSLQNRSTEVRSCATAVAAGLGVSFTHSIFDFPWYIPACMSIAIMLAACAFALSRQAATNRARRKQAPSVNIGAFGLNFIGLGMVTVLAIFVLTQIGPAIGAQHYDQYLVVSLRSQKRLPGKGTDEYRRARRLAESLDQVLVHDPHHPRAHARMASVCLQLFEIAQTNNSNSMPLSQIREAAIASQFPDQPSLNRWLDAAIGTPRCLIDKALYHAQQATYLNPLVSSSYLHLADLVFLQLGSANDTRAMIAAAEQVRPYDAAVMFAIGREAAMQGNTEQILYFWGKAFRYSHKYRTAIIEGLGASIPAPLFVQHFEPDTTSLNELFRFYRKNNLKQHAGVVGPVIATQLADRAATQSGVPAAKTWHQVRDIHRYLGQMDRALQAAQAAANVAPNWWLARRSLGDELLANGLYDECIDQYTWCVKRRPFDKKMQNLLRNTAAIRRRSNANIEHPQIAQPPATRRTR